MLSILAMCTPSVLDSPYPLPPPVYRESPIVEEDEDDFDWRTPSKSSHKNKTPSRTPARALILPPITPKSSNVKLIWYETVSPPILERKQSQFDILTSLPPELGLKILQYLRPQDLCK